MTASASAPDELTDEIWDTKRALRKRGKYRYDSPTGAVSRVPAEAADCPHSPAMIRVLIAEALREPRYVRRKTASYLVVDGKLIPDGKGDFIRVPKPRKPSRKRVDPEPTYIWADERECRFPSRYTDGGRFSTPHRKDPASNDNVPARPRWRVARPVGKLRERLPIVTTLRKEDDRLFRPDIDTPREALIYTAQVLADDFEIAALPAGYVPTNHCRHTEEHLEGFKLERRENERGEYEGAARKARSETFAWLPVMPKEAFTEGRFSIVAGHFTATEPVLVDTVTKIEEETTRHVSRAKGSSKPVVEMRDWVITTTAVYRVNVDGISVWQSRVRTSAVDADGSPKHDGRPTNEMRFIRKDPTPASREAGNDISGADERIASVQRLEIIKRVLSKNQFRMLRMACREGANMTEIAEAFGFGKDKRAIAEVRGILREALIRTAEVFAKLAAIDRGDDRMSVRDWIDLGDIDKVLTAGNDNQRHLETDRGHLVAA